MCGIVGHINQEKSLEKTYLGLNKQYYRGLDSCGIYNGESITIFPSLKDVDIKKIKENNFTIAHTLHSLVDFVPQPIKSNTSILVFNGEIYNWEELDKQFDSNSLNDSELLQKLLDSFSLDSISECLYLLDGVWSFAYYRDNKIILSRDILGVKPLFYDFNSGLSFASENKTLENNGVELNPREIVIYDVHHKTIEIKNRPFEYSGEVFDKPKEVIEEEVWDLLKLAVKKRIPKDKKVGLLFSGGIDSTVIALILKELGVEFTCYSAKVEGGNIEEAEDLIYAKEIALKYDLNLKVAKVSLEELEDAIVESMKLIEDCDYIKTSVSLPFLLSCRLAKEDDVAVMFSGLGSEEIFAGYRRHKQCTDPNRECYEGLLIMHKRDLFRDDVLTMANQQELRVPFLDKELVEYCLKIPVEYKIDMKKVREIKDRVLANPSLNSLVISKIILRDCATRFLNLESRYSQRQKKAAQYGSKFDKGLLRLAKNSNMQKQDYLDQLWDDRVRTKRPQRIWY